MYVCFHLCLIKKIIELYIRVFFLANNGHLRHLLLLLEEEASLKISPFRPNIYAPKVLKVLRNIGRVHIDTEETSGETSGANSS